MKNQRVTYYIILLLVALQCSAINIVIANVDSSRTIFKDMFAQEFPSLIIEANFTDLAQKGIEEVPAQLTITGLSKEVWNIKLATRGKYRRRVCAFTPLTLNFKKGDLKDEGYLPFDDVKIVTHCNDPVLGLENVYKEFLAYELYNHITPQSFKAKIVAIKYIDSLDLTDTISSWAVILEPNKELANRLGGEIFDKWNLPVDSLDAENYTTMAMFQFMIGNHDWSLEMHRNIKCLYREDIGKYLIIPYDFDFSGFVNPEYYIAPQDLEITHPKDRLYLGKYFEDNIPGVVEKFLAQKEVIIKHCKAFDQLPSRARSELNGYINSFCKVLKRNGDHITYNYLIQYNDY